MDFFDMDSRPGRLFAWIVLLLTVVYVGGHFVKAHAWDGFMDLNSGYGMSTSGDDLAPDIEIVNGTRETVENSGVLIPGGEIQVTDSEGNVHDMEVIVVNPRIEGAPVTIEAYDAETNEYYDLQMNLR